VLITDATIRYLEREITSTRTAAALYRERAGIPGTPAAILERAVAREQSADQLELLLAAAESLNEDGEFAALFVDLLGARGQLAAAALTDAEGGGDDVAR